MRGAHVAAAAAAAAEGVWDGEEEEEEVPEDEGAVREVCRRLYAEKRSLVRVEAFENTFYSKRTHSIPRERILFCQGVRWCVLKPLAAC